jgi:hypothetical protein
MQIPDTLTDLIGNPAWLAHRYDPGHDAFHFRWVDRDRHAATTFLTEEALVDAPGPIPVARADTAPPVTTPLHFIFHSAYCCSTMLARAFDAPGTSMALKEPLLLNDMVGWRRRGGEPARVAEVLDRALALLARPFAPGEAVVVKPSNVVNALAPVILALRPEAKALLLHAPLPAYLRSIAKKDMWGRLWVRELLVGLLKDGLVDLGFDTEGYLGLTDLQVAAVGWLAQHALFARTVARYGPARVATLDSETLVARSRDAMAALVRLYGLSIDPAGIDAIVAGPAFTRHSKLSAEFGAAQRAAEHRNAADLHGDEIIKVVIWAEAAAKAAGIPLTLGARLID